MPDTQEKTCIMMVFLRIQQFTDAYTHNTGLKAKKPYMDYLLLHKMCCLY